MRGVRTNIKFLRNVMRHPRFVSGAATTGFIADTPELLALTESHDRATRILQYIGDLSINGNPTVKGERPTGLRKPVVPGHDLDAPIPPAVATAGSSSAARRSALGCATSRRF